jgi:hypothetical protein
MPDSVGDSTLDVRPISTSAAGQPLLEEPTLVPIAPLIQHTDPPAPNTAPARHSCTGDSLSVPPFPCKSPCVGAQLCSLDTLGLVRILQLSCPWISAQVHCPIVLKEDVEIRAVVQNQQHRRRRLP